MIKFDEKAILKKADEVRNNEADTKELFDLIGGDELERIFEKGAIETILDTLVQEKKTHSLYDENKNGLAELEGLLNNKITGELGKFYMMKPEYIMSLSVEEQEHMAESISEGNENLKTALLTLWKEGIETEACGGVRTSQKETPYIYVKVPLKNTYILERLNNIIQKDENYLDLCINEEDESLGVVIKGESIYQDVVEEFQKASPKKSILDFLANEQILTINILDKHIEKNEFEHKKFDYQLAEMKIKYKYKTTIYKIKVKNNKEKNTGVERFIVNGSEVANKKIILQDDGKIYNIEVFM